jgi:hypothetical protein
LAVESLPLSARERDSFDDVALEDDDDNQQPPPAMRPSSSGAVDWCAVYVVEIGTFQ